MIKECDIYTLLNASDIPVIDVRSPAEFNHAHIPGAINIPLFNDEERKTVGIIYKQESKTKAIETGLDLAGKKLSMFIREAKAIAKNNTLFIHCWRGGMRSKSMATLFDFAGINTLVLNGGYKSYRREIQNFFNYPFPFVILGGKTGSGKTEVLHFLKQQGEQVIDMEALANHKGSAFGALGEQLQPSTEQFENNLFEELRKCNLQKYIWLEDESHLIGTVFIPEIIWFSMRRAHVVFLDIPIKERIAFLVSHYGKYPAEEIESALQKITKRLGGQHYKETLELYRNGNLADATEKVLTYYDKTYAHGLSSRNKATIHHLQFDSLQPENIAANCSAFLKTNMHLQSSIYY
ncbi:MAG: tRNA 2-selenouridine(34) synthase MnmH [Bacteroidetes bacterium]|nr:tRNA 2-selenouridine(34) synthase MnmH [Bacteroidota bacterium]MBK7107600.1 tRNA 2-selenouridine(34) synthase MnmH [Bacteroidota bacterium]MBP7399439.1 tRNA 2-selenouridine(34) synthase MnmH [Chitinophagales bacterium]MBP9188236.1 tRNA 2-selenouridine(34) synthase MnmH [Chitinophagales bacterium]